MSSREDNGLVAQLFQPGDYGSANQPSAACYRNAHLHLHDRGEFLDRGAVHPPLSFEQQRDEGLLDVDPEVIAVAMSLEGFQVVVNLVQREARSVVGALVNQEALAAWLCFTHPRVLGQQPSHIFGRLWCRPVVGYDGDHAAPIGPPQPVPKCWLVPSGRT